MELDPDNRKLILVVDDGEEIRAFYRLILESAGYAVATACNGQEGLELMRAIRPDLLIVDVVMPVMDGLELLLRLRSDFAPPVPPAILNSGFDVTEEEALRRGAYAFIPKPVSPDDLLLLAKDALSNQAPDAAVLARERKRSAAAREAASLAAEEALRANPAEDLSRRMSWALDWLRTYLDADEVLMAIIRNGHLTMISHREPNVDLAPPPSSITEIITTGSTLVLPDVARYPFFASDLKSLEGLHSLVGVPVVGPSHVVTGAACLARRRIEPFPAEDVLILEHMGRRAGELLQGIKDGEADPYRGFGLGFDLPAVAASGFEIMVEMELRIAVRRHHVIELAFADLGADFDRPAAEVLSKAVDPKRMVVFMLSLRRIALLKRGADAGSVSQQIDAALDALRLHMRVHSVGSMVVAASVGGFVDSQSLIHLARRQLTHCAGTGRLERAHLRADDTALHVES